MPYFLSRLTRGPNFVVLASCMSHVKVLEFGGKIVFEECFGGKTYSVFGYLFWDEFTKKECQRKKEIKLIKVFSYIKVRMGF